MLNIVIGMTLYLTGLLGKFLDKVERGYIVFSTSPLFYLHGIFIYSEFSGFLGYGQRIQGIRE